MIGDPPNRLDMRSKASTLRAMASRKRSTDEEAWQKAAEHLDNARVLVGSMTKWVSRAERKVSQDVWRQRRSTLGLAQGELLLLQAVLERMDARFATAYRQRQRTAGSE